MDWELYLSSREFAVSFTLPSRKEQVPRLTLHYSPTALKNSGESNTVALPSQYSLYICECSVYGRAPVVDLEHLNFGLVCGALVALF